MGVSTKHNNGMAQSIRDVLKTSPEPMSCYQIALALGAKQEKVKHALSQMIVVSGGVVATKGVRGVVYGLYKTPEREKTKGNVAGKIIYPGYVYGASRLG